MFTMDDVHIEVLTGQPSKPAFHLGLAIALLRSGLTTVHLPEDGVHGIALNMFGVDTITS
jgi:hypothetical protein